MSAAQLGSSGTPISQIIYQQCSSILFNNFNVEFQKSYMNFISSTVEKYRILVYNGQFDLRCCVYGTSEWLRILPWSGRFSFNFRSFSQFNMGGTTTRGLYKQYKNLIQMVVYGAGHLVPMDQGDAAFEMMRRFTNNIPLLDGCTQEPCYPYECPNLCSGRGICMNTTGICQCNPGYSGEDCSIVQKNQVSFYTTYFYSGISYGKSPHIYYYQIYSNNANNTGLYNVQIQVSKISKVGRFFIYLGDNVIIPDESSQESLLSQFRFRNLEDSYFKTLYATQLDASVTPNVTILILNNVDVPAPYDINILFEPSGPTYDAVVITVNFIFKKIVGSYSRGWDFCICYSKFIFDFTIFLCKKN